MKNLRIVYFQLKSYTFCHDRILHFLWSYTILFMKRYTLPSNLNKWSGFGGFRQHKICVKMGIKATYWCKLFINIFHHYKNSQHKYFSPKYRKMFTNIIHQLTLWMSRSFFANMLFYQYNFLQHHWYWGGNENWQNLQIHQNWLTHGQP